MASPLLILLRKHRETYRRLVELETAELDRQIAALERARPGTTSTTRLVDHAGCEHERALLHAMQAAGTPLPPREIAQRLNTTPRTVSRWLAAAKRRGFVERVGNARYAVAKEVPPM